MFFELRLGEQLVIVHAHFPRDLFLTDDGRFVVVQYRRVVDHRSCGAMESQVSSVSLFVLARLSHEADKIVIAVLLIVRGEENDGGENGLDLDKVGVRWLDEFDLEFFSSCFEDRGEFFGRHGV